MASQSSLKAAETLMAFDPIYQGVINRSIRSVADESLTHLQIQALFLLHDVGPLAMHQISARLHMSKQHLTRFVDALVKRGLLERFQKENNRRTVYIKITELGTTALKKYIAYAIETVAEMLEKLEEKDKSDIIAAADLMMVPLKKLI